MASRSTNFKVGLFVIVGLAMAAGAIAWLGASQYMAGATYYVTFFNDSVQGLQKDSSVKYRGVDVGRVTDIRVAPDYRLIEVVMAIQFEGDLSRTMVAQLKSAGITGITFIELDRTEPGEVDNSPSINFAAEYPIIPSKPSELTKILTVVDKVMGQLNDVNFKGMADKLDHTLASVEHLVGDKRLDGTMTNLEAASASLKKITQTINAYLDAGHVQELVAHADQAVQKGGGAMSAAQTALDNTRELVDMIRREIKEMRLKELAQRMADMVEGVERKGDDISLSARMTADNLRRASENLDRLLRRLEQDPSAILFSSPPAGRDMGERQGE